MKFLKNDNFLTENRRIGITKKEEYFIDSIIIVEYIIIETESCDSYRKKSYIRQRMFAQKITLL